MRDFRGDTVHPSTLETMHQLGTLDGFKRGREYFQQAIERDPDYAATHAGLADTASRLAFFGYVNSEEGCARTKVAALRAIELDDLSSEAHAALGFSLLHSETQKMCENL